MIDSAFKAARVAFLLGVLLVLGCVSGPSGSGNISLPEFKPDPPGLDRRISINENREFTVNGKRIWMSGANTPWDKWNDFGGAYNDEWWEGEFKRLRMAGVNSTRVWINCNNGTNAISIETNGMISGVSDKHWSDLDEFFETARRNRIYIMATLLSFDHFKNDGSRPAANRWRAMLTTGGASESFAEQYTIPFVQRYGDNPWLWSIDIMNEPEWLHETDEGGRMPWEPISYFLAVQAAAIHENSKVLVTVGFASPKFYADGLAYEGNKVSDRYLQSLYPNENAYLDFWSPHYYDWMGPWYGVAFYAMPNRYGMELTKPALIGECPAKGSSGNTANTQNNTIVTDFHNAYMNRWQGVMTWTSNGVDGNGDLNDSKSGSLYMLEKFRDLIYPWD